MGETVMAKDSFIKKLASVFSGAPHEAPLDDQPVASHQAAQQPATQVADAEPSPIPLDEPTETHPIIHAGLAEALRDLAIPIGRLTESSRTQASLAQALRDSMAKLEEKREESTAAMREIAETLAHQTDVLVDLQAKAKAGADNAAQLASELHSLSDAIVSTNLANARNVEVLDQIRQRFDGANTQLANEGRRISKLMIAVIALQAIFLLAALIKWIILR
jgi:hypothetical protein